MINEKKLRTTLRRYNYQAKLADDLYKKRRDLNENIDRTETDMVNKYAEVAKMLGLKDDDAEFVMDAMYENRSNMEEQVKVLITRANAVLLT